MSNNAELRIFKNFEMNDSEEVFLREVLAGRDPMYNVRVNEAKKVLSTFYLAKRIEASSKASDKHSKAMKHLTFALVGVGFLQVIIAIFF